MFGRNEPAPLATGLEEQMQALQNELDQAQQQLAALEREAAAGDAKAATTSDIALLSTISHHRTKLRQDAETVKHQMDAARHRLTDMRNQHEQRLMHLDFLQQRKRGLVVALAESSGAGHERVESELLQVLRQLANLTRDAEAAQELIAFEKRLEDSKPFITLRRGYAWTSDRRLVAEDDREATVTAYGKGLRVDRAEAVRFGLDKLEAQS